MSYYLFYGNSIDNLKYIIKNDILNKKNIHYFDLALNEFSNFEKLLFQNSFFEEKKYIMVENLYLFLNKNKDNFENIYNILKYTNENEVYFFENEIDYENERLKKILLYIQIEKIEYIDFNYIKMFIKNKLDNYEIKISEDLIDYILNKTKDDLHLIANELDKLIINSINSKKITKKDIDNLVKQQMDENIYDLLTLIKNNNKEESIILLNKLLTNNISPILIIDKLCLSYIDLYKVKKLVDKKYDIDYISKFLKYSFNKTYHLYKEQANFTYSYLKEKIEKLTDYDFLIKSSTFNVKDYLEIFIMER